MVVAAPHPKLELFKVLDPEVVADSSAMPEAHPALNVAAAFLPKNWDENKNKTKPNDLGFGGFFGFFGHLA